MWNKPVDSVSKSTVTAYGHPETSKVSCFVKVNVSVCGVCKQMCAHVNMSVCVASARVCVYMCTYVSMHACEYGYALITIDHS